MAYDGYLCYGGTEIVNHCRSQALQRTGHGMAGYVGCDCCDDLPPDDHGAYGDITQAPWYDPDEDRSERFAGFQITEISGLDEPAEARVNVSDLAIDGSIIGPLRRSGRVVTVTGFLIAGDCCGNTYGLRWLTHALSNAAGCDTCGGADLRFYECCCPDPPPPTSGCSCEDFIETSPGSPSSPTSPASPGEESPAECAERMERVIHDVHLISGPTVTDTFENPGECGGCPVREIQFVLQSTSPYVYEPFLPEVVAGGMTFREPGDCIVVGQDCGAGCTDDGQPIEWVECGPPGGPPQPGCDDCDVTSPSDDLRCPDWVVVLPGQDPPRECRSCEEQQGPCVTDPDCVPRLPPGPPPPANPCSCDPLIRRQVCLHIPREYAREISELVPEVVVWGGRQGLRHIKVRIYPDRTCRMDEPALDECGYCTELNYGRVPPNAELRLSWANRKATVRCPGRQPENASSLLGGPEGKPAVWPALECDMCYTLCLSVNAMEGAPPCDATFDVALSRRTT